MYYLLLAQTLITQITSSVGLLLVIQHSISFWWSHTLIWAKQLELLAHV